MIEIEKEIEVDRGQNTEGIYYYRRDIVNNENYIAWSNHNNYLNLRIFFNQKYF